MLPHTLTGTTVDLEEEEEEEDEEDDEEELEEDDEEEEEEEGDFDEGCEEATTAVEPFDFFFPRLWWLWW